MTEHAFRTVERHCDVAVVGGSAAGLGAALQLGRQRRSVIVVDAGEPRNAPAGAVHGFLGREGVAPSELAATAREEVRSYGGEILAGRAVAVTPTSDGRFRVVLSGGHSIVARRVLAAGNVTDPTQQVLHAAADGSRVAAMISLSLAHEDLRSAARPSGHQADWDHRYGDEPLWSGRPNGSLVGEVTGMTPGRALDVGAGEGGDAMWLVAQGWKVTATDISPRALDRVGAEARRRGLRVECHHADANALGVFETGGFDLVSAQYASIPRTPDARGVRNMIEAVAPGGVLLVVGHDLEPMRQPIDNRSGGHAFDPDAYLRTDDFAAVLTTTPGWEIETHDKRPRPPGAASASYHVDDIVLRARRHPH